MKISFLFHVDDVPCRYPPYKAKEIFKLHGIGSNYIDPEEFPDLSNEYGISQPIINEPDPRIAHAAGLNGGFVKPIGRTVGSPILAKHSLVFADNSLYPGMVMPSHVGAQPYHQIGLTDITSTLPNNQAAPRLLVPTSRQIDDTIGRFFEYIGEYPQNYLMTGTLNVLIRVNENETPSGQRAKGISPLFVPGLKLYLVDEHTGLTTTLASSMQVGGKPFKIDGRNKPYVNILPFATVKGTSSVSKNFDVSVGYFPENSNSPDTLGLLGNKLLTSWFDIGSETVLLVKVTDTGHNLLRIQWMSEDGSIEFDTLQTFKSKLPQSGVTRPGEYFLFVPANAVACRICFYQAPEDKLPPAHPEITIFELANIYDPWRGYWVKETMSFNHDGTLSKGSSYGLGLGFVDAVSGDKSKKYGFFLNGNAVSLDLNVRDELQISLDEQIKTEI